MAKKKGRSHKSKKIPVLATAGAVVYGLNAYNGYTAGNAAGKGISGLRWATIGVDSMGKFNMGQLIVDVTPPVIGAVGSMLASKSGLNRYLHSVPLFKL